MILDEIKVPYIKEKSFTKRDRIYVVDFFIPKPYLIAIEVDGGYHKLPKQVELDKERSEFLQVYYKIHTIRIKNEEILQKPEIVKSQLRTKLRNPSSNISSITSNRGYIISRDCVKETTTRYTL
jgi:very-short-patch-repair endonuclease